MQISRWDLHISELKLYSSVDPLSASHIQANQKMVAWWSNSNAVPEIKYFQVLNTLQIWKKNYEEVHVLGYASILYKYATFIYQSPSSGDRKHDRDRDHKK